MALSRSRRETMNYWPGFVDALSTLILSIIFLLTVFMVAQFFLSQEISGKDTALQSLNAKILQLSQLLSLEQTGKTTLQDEVGQLRASLSAVQDTGAMGLSGGAAVPAGVTEAIDRLRLSVNEAGSGKATTAAMANLAEAIQGLVQHMRAEQQMIRDWADAQAKLNSDIRRFMEILSREAVDR